MLDIAEIVLGFAKSDYIKEIHRVL